jgi:hypothetical protein
MLDCVRLLYYSTDIVIGILPMLMAIDGILTLMVRLGILMIIQVQVQILILIFFEFVRINA